MADDKQPGSGLGGSVILLVAAAASAVYVGWRSPLVSTRPAVSDYEMNQTVRAQDIDARLWQDPFGAVERAIDVKRNGKVDPAAGHCLDDFRSLLSPSDPTLLIGVALPGDPYPEADETRRRLRYAVLSALHVARYTPVDERHIGYFLTNEKPAPSDNTKQETIASGLRLDVAQAVGHSQRSAHSRFFRVAARAGDDPPADGIGALKVATNCAVRVEETGDNDKPSLPAVVPFEEYKNTNRDKYNDTNGRKPDAINGHKRIVVLWIDEEALAHRLTPIASLARLVCELQLYNHDDDRFIFVGPQDSNVLQTMAREAEDYRSTNNNPLNKCPAKSPAPRANEATASPVRSAKTQQVKADEAQPPKPLADDLTVYNFGATADERIILKSAGEKVAANPTNQLHQLFLGARVRYYRTISTDEALAEVLKQELRLRGVDLCPKPMPNVGPLAPNAVPSAGPACGPYQDRIFLLSEWDTEYGRSLPKSVSDVFGADEGLGGCRLNTIHGVMHASYLRGLDGRLPSRRPSKDEKPTTDDGTEATPGEETNAVQPAATPDTARRYETAEGQSQFDYLRRITRLLKECDDKLRLKGEGKIAAIGVLGSDVYDKLLLLQALRPEFPEALFFTTDLDELLLPQGKLRYTRNLLVASGYGLTLTPDLQRDILPFRSTYQTSIFLATQLAITNDNLAHPKSNKANGPEIDPKTAAEIDPRIDPWGEAAATLNYWTKQPQLFQVGRTEPRSLPIASVLDEEDRDQWSKYAHDDFFKHDKIQPNPLPLYPEIRSQALVGSFFLPIVLLSMMLFLPPIRKVFCYPLASFETTAQSEEPAYFGRADLRWLIPFLVLVLITLTIWAFVTLAWPTTAKWLTESGTTGTPGGEPMTLFEGISVWPTIAARTFGVLLSLFLIWYTLRVLEINRRETMNELGIPGGKPDSTRVDLLWRFWFPSKRSLEKSQYGRDDIDRPIVDFQKIVSSSSPKPWIRCGRALGYTLILMVLGIVFLGPMSSSAPSVPARGARAGDIFKAITFVDVIVTVFLTMLVTDATLHSRRFIALLTDVSTRWPHKTRMKFEQRFGVSDNALADWLDMQYIRLKTSCITQLVYLPFLSLSLLLLTRSHLFDDFSMPWTLLVFYGIIIVVLVGSVLAYRSAAESARKVAREHLMAKIIAAQGDKRIAGQLRRLLSEIENLKEGAFAPWMSQPVVKAVLLPLVTYGGAWLAHIYGLPGT